MERNRVSGFETRNEARSDEVAFINPARLLFGTVFKIMRQCVKRIRLNIAEGMIDPNKEARCEETRNATVQGKMDRLLSDTFRTTM